MKESTLEKSPTRVTHVEKVSLTATVWHVTKEFTQETSRIHVTIAENVFLKDHI